MTFAHQQLRSFVDRVCNLNDEIKALNGDKSEVYKEAKANGYDPKVLKAAVKRYTQLQDDRLGVEEFDAILELYMEALLGSEASDDQGASKSPPAASASPAKGIVASPTRVHAREADPPHDEDGVLIEDETATIANGGAVVAVAAETDHPAGFVAASPINSTCRTEPVFSDGCRPCFAPAPGAGGSSAKGDAGEIPFQDASPTIPQSVAVILPDLATVAPDPSPEVRSGAPISEMPDIPEFLRRTGT